MKSCDMCPTSRKLYVLVLLRNDDLLILFAAIALKATFLCGKKRELLPFVKRFNHQLAIPFKC